jgi:hypothetical protein
VPDLQADVPQAGHQSFQGSGKACVGIGVDDDQDVDVGGRLELLPTVSADGDQGGVFGLSEVVVPDLAQDVVDEEAASQDQAPDR